jgi:hypothetical protein
LIFICCGERKTLKEKEAALRQKNTAKLLFFLLLVDHIYFKETVQKIAMMQRSG